jgi:EAL domain-containing protein (putative c-di-GMP-specific phosphodiesterase class I)
MGCDTVQGFVFARPLFETEFLDWIRSADHATRSVA